MAERTSIYDASIKALREEPEIVKASVITNIGEFAQIITIKGREFNLTLQIPKTESVEEGPLVSLQSGQTSEETIKEISDDLKRLAVEHLTSADLPSRLFSMAQNSLPSSTESTIQMKKEPVRKPEKKQRHKRSEDVEKRKKKVAMKTAEEVVKRIQWDEKISTDDISIGYLDRFKGIQEKAFSAFSWEDIASVDYFTFAIPKHRIEYFKYKRCVVWDKSKRLDNVFGSTGSGRTIYDEMSDYKDEDYVNEAPTACEFLQKLECPQPVNVEMEMEDNFAAYDSESSEDESDDDDGVVVTLKDREGKLYSESDEDDEEGATAGDKEYWRDKLRPNFLICIRVTSEDVRSMVSHVQDIVVDREERYESCCVPEAMLHVTLCTLRLNDAEEATHCLQILKKYSEELRSSLPTSSLKIAGLDRFFHRVLYAKVHHGDDFIPFKDHLCSILRTEGIRIMDNHDFVPHMTVMKVSRPVSRAMGTKYISPYVFSDIADTQFGEQDINSVYLCSMEKTRGPDGFYMSPGSITFMKEVI